MAAVTGRPAERYTGAAPPDTPPPAVFLGWSPVVAGAFVAAAVSFVLLSFGSGLGLAVASPSATWRDASAALAAAGGVWLLLTALAAFGLGGYLAGRLREPWADGTTDASAFRDGVHGLVVWALAVVIGAVLALAAARSGPARPDLAVPTAATAEPLLAFELDELFRSDRAATASSNDAGLRAEAARIIAAGLGRPGMAEDDRAWLVRLVAARTGLAEPDAAHRVDRVVAEAGEAVARARRGGVIVAFMIAASLALGLAAAWLAAELGGEHRDSATHHAFWRRWDVDRTFRIR